MNLKRNNYKFSAQEIKQAAIGHWAEIIPALTGIPADFLDGKGHPCPKPGCGGTDRFSAFSDFSNTGGAICRHCHHGGSEPKSGDGIAVVQWMRGCTFPEALQFIARHLGLSRSTLAPYPPNILNDLCKQKRMPLESAKAYGAFITTRKTAGGQLHVVRFPIYDHEGKPTSSFDLTPYKTGKLNKGVICRGGTGGLFLPNGRLPQPDETWLLVEGVKDAAALHGLGFNAAGTTGCHLKAELLPKFAQMFRGSNLVLVPDLDWASFRGFAVLGAAFGNVVHSLLVARLPGKIKPTKGDDVRDIMVQNGVNAVQNAINSATPFDAESFSRGRGKVNISLDHDNEQEVANKVIKILASRGFATDDVENRIYQRGGKLVAIAMTDMGPTIVPLDEVGIRERITAGMDLVQTKIDSDGNEYEQPVRPPGWLCKAIHARPTYQYVHKLDGLVTAPTMREDGSILQDEGYDADSRLLYLPEDEFQRVPEEPTKEDAVDAINELLEIVVDFPFKDDSSKSVWVGLLLTLLGRAAVRGNVPLFAFTANIRGSGKSKLCDLAGLITFGGTMARKTLPRDEEETRKLITAIALEARPAVLLDNADGLIGNASLDAVLTSEKWNDRILGKSETTGDLTWRTVLMTTGNNLSFRADTARRVLLCQLDCHDENPEDRDDFTHANIEAHTVENRHRLVVAALTILRAYVVAGRCYEGKRLGSYESWSELICGAVSFAGLPNPLSTVSIVREQDNTKVVLNLILDGIEEIGGTQGLTSLEISDGLKNTPTDYKHKWRLLKTAFSEFTDKPTTRKVGNILKGYKSRVSCGRRLLGKPGRANVTRWVVEKVETALDNAEPHLLDELEVIENCDQCGERLSITPTDDGYLNRHCEPCDKAFRCIPNPAGPLYASG